MSAQRGFAIWITGIPASGKTTITRELVKKLEARGIRAVVLESDEMRTILTPNPTYLPEERDRFYHALALIGAVITRSGVNVIFDATANMRAYREYARLLIPDFIEVYVKCSLEVSMNRDPKGIYRNAAAGNTTTVPGLQTPYEPPLSPEITLQAQNLPQENTDEIINKLTQLLYI